MIVKELTFTMGVDERSALESNIHTLTLQLNDHKRQRDAWIASYAKVPLFTVQLLPLLDAMRDIMPEEAVNSRANMALYTPLNNIHIAYHDLRNWLSMHETTNQNQLSHAERSIAHVERSLADYRLQLARAKPARAYTLQSGDFRKEVARSVNGKNTRLHKAKWGRKSIETVFDDIVITPSLRDGHLPPWVKVLDGKPACVRIPPVKVVIDLEYRNIFAKCVKSSDKPLRDQGYIMGFSGYYSAHPHVTNRTGALCLGDWGGALMEALDSGDVILTLDVLKQFLRSANDADPAGANWRRYLSNEAHYNWNMNMAPAVAGTDGLYEYYLLDGKGGVTRYRHTDPHNWPEIQINNLAEPPQVIITELPETEDMPDADDCDLVEPREGYDEDGYDEDGYDREGYNEDGYDRAGYNREGYDRDGFDGDGFDEDGYDREGYNEDGYDRDGVHYDSEAA